MTAPHRPSSARAIALRRCLLAVSVLHDLDLTWDESADGTAPDLTVDGTPPVRVSGARLDAVLADRDLDAPATVEHLARWLLLRRTLVTTPLPLVLEGLRVVGLPSDHPHHPGPDWSRLVLPGGALTLGLGLLPDVGGDEVPAQVGGLFGAPTAVEAQPPVPLPVGVLEDAGIDPRPVWPHALARLEHLGGLAAARRGRRPRDPLRPMAEADVVTLLGSRRLRFALASETSTGLAALVVPMRRRGWVSSSAIDPAFGPAAAAATEEHERGFARPLLVTEYEVVQVPAGGHPLRHLGQSAGSRWS